MKVTRSQGLNSESVCQEEESKYRGSEPSKDPVGVRSKGKVLGGAGECSNEEGAWPGNWRGALRLCHHRLRHVDSILWVMRARRLGAGLCHI